MRVGTAGQHGTRCQVLPDRGRNSGHGHRCWSVGHGQHLPGRLVPASPGDCRCPGPNPGTSLGGAALAPGRAASTAMSHRSTLLTRRRSVSRSLHTVLLGNPMRPARQLPLPRPSRQAIEALAVLMYVLLLPAMIALPWWEDRPLIGGVEAHRTVRRTARSTRRRALFLPADDSQDAERDHPTHPPPKCTPASGLGSNGRACAPHRTPRPLDPSTPRPLGEENEA